MKPAPCKPNGIDCPDRTLGCSERCEKFLEWERYKNGIRSERDRDIERNKPIGRRLKRRDVY